MKKIRQLLLRLHQTVGVAIGLLLVAIGITGSIIVFNEEIDRALNPTLMQVVPEGDRLSIDAIVLPALQEVDADTKLEFIRLPQKPEETYQLGLKSNKHLHLHVYINPYTGKILGQRYWEYSLVGFLYKLHYSLLAGTVGEIVVGICAVLFLLLGVTGIMLWPGWRKWPNGFQVRWTSAPRAVQYDLHKVGGILSAVFLILISASGALIVLASHSQSFLALFLGPPQPEPELASEILPGEQPIMPSQILQKADAALPGGRATRIMFPEQKQREVVVRKQFPEASHDLDLSSVSLDRYAGEVLSVKKVLEMPAGLRVGVAIVKIHFGTFGGLPTRILYVLIGFVPTLLFGTGFVLWRQRMWAIARRQEAIHLSSELLRTTELKTTEVRAAREIQPIPIDWIWFFKIPKWPAPYKKNKYKKTKK